MSFPVTGGAPGDGWPDNCAQSAPLQRIHQVVFQFRYEPLLEFKAIRSKHFQGAGQPSMA